jgi:ribonuclease G
MVVVDEIENDIKYLSQEQNEKKLTVIVHPFVRSYITSGLFKSIRRKWQKKYRIKIEVISSSDHGIMEYAFLNAENEEVKL